MAIVKNSAKCNYCGTEIESKHRHDFNVHYCDLHKKPSAYWVGEGADMKLEEKGIGSITWNFAVDGGRAYIRRCGEGFTDTSIYSEDEGVAA